MKLRWDKLTTVVMIPGSDYHVPRVSDPILLLIVSIYIIQSYRHVPFKNMNFPTPAR